jgi:hypothetical protein
MSAQEPIAGVPRQANPVLWLALTAFALAASVVVALLAYGVASGPHSFLALLVPLFVLLPLLPVTLWQKPQAGILAIFIGSLFIEQFAYEVGPRAGAATASIPLFHSITPGAGVTVFEVLLALMLVILVLKHIRDRKQLLAHTAMSRRLGLLLLVVALYLLLGLVRHGDAKMALWEVRPFLYLALLYVLSAALLTTARALRVLMWSIIIGCSIKAIYGIAIWVSIRNLNPRPEAVLAHEESFFFALFALLVMGLWLFGVRGALRTTGTVLLPVVLFADMCNSRRTAWALLFAGALFMAVAAYVGVPERRRILRRIGLVVLLVSSAYFPAFWSKEGTIAQPARAMRSEIAPSPRDEMSNQYRFIEDMDLMLNIQQHKIVGSGFGIPIQYYVAITDLRSQNKAISYIPHNGVLYLWMRVGLLGSILFWLVIAEGMRLSCQLARSAHRESALLGALTGCALVAYVLMGNKDLGFFWFRIAAVMGILVGAVEARARVVAVPPPHEALSRHPVSTSELLAPTLAPSAEVGV